MPNTESSCILPTTYEENKAMSSKQRKYMVGCVSGGTAGGVSNGLLAAQDFGFAQAVGVAVVVGLVTGLVVSLLLNALLPD